MIKNFIITAIMILSISLVANGQTIRLDQLEIEKGTNGWGTIKRNRSINGNPLTLKGVVYKYGVGTHAEGRIDIFLNGKATRFRAVVGVDDEAESEAVKAEHGVAKYQIINHSNGEDIVVKEGRISRADKDPVTIDIDITGWENISLLALMGNGNNWADHVDWCNAEFDYSGTAPVAVTYADMINNTILFDCITHHYSLPNTRMMHKIRTNRSTDIISIDGELPAGLTFNKERKIVVGKIEKEGKYAYRVSAKRGETTITKEFTVAVSSKLVSPAPLMGWMSWNIFQQNINEKNIKETADLLVSTGLKEAGFRYVLIDDHWHAPNRAADGKPQYNTTKFPSGMKNLTEYIHSKGLKAGIYSDAAEKTCGGEFGGLNYETIDANTYAQWEFDFLKYDYCGAPNDVNVAKVRYKKMSDALKATGREFFFNICEWGERKPWLWAAEAGGNAWRATFDSRDTWNHKNQYDSGHNGAIQTIDLMKGLEWYAGPNQYNDADMLCVGLYGTGKPSSHDGANGMNDTEYQSQFSMWCMFASPLLISFDLSTIDQLSQATRKILTNSEAIAINQDLMGQQATCIYSEGGREVYMKDLENGDVAVALLNRNNHTTKISIPLEKLFLDGRYIVRDVWKKEDIEKVTERVSANVKAHETKLYRLKKDNNTGVINNETAQNRFINISQDDSFVNLSFESSISQGTLKIVDINGREIESSNIAGKSYKIAKSQLAKGIYLVNVTSEKRSSSAKFVVTQ